jgi:hypothetical protein
VNSGQIFRDFSGAIPLAIEKILRDDFCTAMKTLLLQTMTYVNKRSPKGDLVKRFMRLEWRGRCSGGIDFGLN